MTAAYRRSNVSALQSYKDLREDFSKGQFKQIYLFYGAESYLTDRLQKILIDKVLSPEDRDFNLDILQGAEVSVQSALNMCQTAPMMVERRIVIIRGFDQMKNNKMFVPLAAHPNPAAIVLLTCEARPRFNADPYRALKKNSKSVQIVEFAPLWRNQVPQFIHGYAKTKGYELEGEVAPLLVDFLGTDMALLAQEIDKLIAYVGGQRRISKKDLLQASGQTREINVFELQDAIVQRRAAAAYQITEQLLLSASSRQGEVLRIIAVLNSYFMKLGMLHEARQERVRHADLPKKTGIPPSMIRRYQEATRKWPLPEIHRAMHLLLSVDSEIKGLSKRSPRMIMTLFITRLLSEPSK